MIYFIIGYIISIFSFYLLMKYNSKPVTEEEEQCLEEYDKNLRNSDG